jgi:hypothetical protein
LSVCRYTYNILNGWKNSISLLFGVHNDCDVRQIEVHTVEPLVPGPSRLEVEIGLAEFKKYKSQVDRHCGLVVRILGYRS